jgi:diguanylate cyclase (GGDEF)-like protein
MSTLGGNDLDAIAIPVPWHNGEAGIDVFVALLENPASATSVDVRAAKLLRIGVNFNAVVQQDMPRVIRRMLLFSIAIALIMLAGLIVMLQHIMRPLKELRKGLRAVANGDLNYQVPVYSQDEVGSLVKAYNGTIHRLRYAFEQIESLATLDPLTGLPNRRIFDERIAIEAKRSRRYGHPFGLIMLDLDHFKQINDRFGHPVGDEVLRLVAKTIEAGVRETDLVARIGGEEFAVILPESKAPEVRAVAEKIRIAVEDIQFTPGDGQSPVKITISAGAACALGRLVTTEGLVAATDAALYRSKAEGRNRVTMAERVTGGSGINPGIQG